MVRHGYLLFAMSVEARWTASMIADVGAAAAQMRRGPSVVNAALICASSARRALEQFGGLDHHAVLAEAAQRHLLVDPRLLHRVQRLLRVGGRQLPLLRPPGGQAFERRDFLAGHLRSGVTQERISLPSTSTEQAPHCAMPHPNWGRRSRGRCEDVEERRICRRIHLAARAVDGERHDMASSLRGARMLATWPVRDARADAVRSARPRARTGNAGRPP